MSLERRSLANAIRALSMDAVQQANSGHPGAPMGMADIAEVLWNDHLKHNPQNPGWIDRDRFILSNGHGSMLLYSLLHLSGYDLPMQEIRNFRQLHSKTPGHPEIGVTPGVETTTGPLGQGLANGVGMALAEKKLAAEFNREDLKIFDHHTYVFVGDGCLMEGISHEACSLAGTLGLGKLIVFYDDNSISIDGDVSGWFTDDTAKRFESYGWQVVPNVDGHDFEAIGAAITQAKSDSSKPTLIQCKTIIGYGSPNKAGSADSHGAPLGDEEIQATRTALGWNHPPFEIPKEIAEAWDHTERGREDEDSWNELFARYAEKYPNEAKEIERRLSCTLPENWESAMNSFIHEQQEKKEKIATRAASKQAIAAVAKLLPELVGGSADLSGSNSTKWSEAKTYTAENPNGNYLHYGVREFGMSALINGMMIHGGYRPFAGTFLMFMEYARNAVRMAALMKVPSIFVYSHDSIGLGEDGPTHQAVEQAAALRVTPNMATWRPCDTVETAAAWKAAIERKDGPSALLLTRQGVPAMERTAEQLEAIERGAYVLYKTPSADPEVLFLATGSEVDITLKAAKKLEADGRAVQVVSMPCVEVFRMQPPTYQDLVWPKAVKKRVVVEAGIAEYWRGFAGDDGEIVGMDTFGESAPNNELFEYFGFTETNVYEKAKAFFN